MDRNQCRVFVLLTHSCVGGLPLGILIVTSESQRTVTAALNLYMEMTGDDAFFGRGRNGSAIFMTDDSASESAALREVFPHSILLLCVFHVLQAFWRYLWDSKSGVPREERPVIFARQRQHDQQLLRGSHAGSERPNTAQNQGLQCAAVVGFHPVENRILLPDKVSRCRQQQVEPGQTVEVPPAGNSLQPGLRTTSFRERL